MLLSKTFKLALVFTICSTLAHGFLRLSYEDATVVERSELIVVGYLKKESIRYTPNPSQGVNGGASWRHHATLVITEVIKGKSTAKEISIIIHYGLDPVIGGKTLRQINMTGIKPDYNRGIEILDTGNSQKNSMPLVEDAGQNNLWFLRRLSLPYGATPGLGDLGINDPEDLQPLQLRDYFTAYLSPNPSEALKQYSAGHPEVSQRVQRYFDHLTVQEALKITDPAKRFEGLLPYYLKGQKWNNVGEAYQGILRCGKVAGEKLMVLYLDPQHKKCRWNIIQIWRQIGYREATPLIIALLEENDRFWAAQKLEPGWWNKDTAAALSRQRRDIYSETYAAVCALRSFADPRARAVLEKTKQRWETINFDNPQILEECNAALDAIAEKDK